MCEALEGLAVVAAVDHDVEETLRLLIAAEQEREARVLPRRAPDELAVLELRRMSGRPASPRPPESTEAVVARLLAAVPEMSS